MTKQSKKSETPPCDGLLHAIRLHDPYAEPQVRKCVRCGQDVFLDVQIYPPWLTAMLQDPRRDALDRPVGLAVGYGDDRTSERAWERLKPLYEMYFPERLNTFDDVEEDEDV